MIKRLKSIPLYVLAIFFTLFTGLPFLIMVNTSFKTSFEFMISPWSIAENFSFQNYTYLFESDFFKYFSNSLIITVISVIGVIIIAAMASYPLAKMKFRLNKPLYVLFLVGMMIPIHTTLIPIFLLTQKIGLYDSIWALLGPYIAFALPMSIIIFVQFFQEIPKELEESAMIDGCGHFRLFWSILFPLLKPAVSTVAIYNFITIINEFIFALVLTTTPEKGTLPIGLKDFYGQFSVNVPGIMAALTLASVPLLLFYFIAQEKVVSGMVSGSVKG